MKREIEAAARAVVRDSLGMARRPVGSRRFRQAVAAAGGDAKIAVGGGRVTLPGWINTDISWRAGYYLDLAKPWPVPAGSVAKVYADNVIEHFPLAVGRQVLRHLFDALKPGGAVRLATPDLERTARAYLENGDLAARHLERNRRHGYTADHPADLLRVTFAENGHHLGYIFDLDALTAEMEAVGFVKVAREEAGESSDPEFAQLEARTSDTERATALVVEGYKAE
jgi:predicted SAM-dependent methyltransferase